MGIVRQINPDLWLEQVFSAKAAAAGGVVRRNRSWVATEIGLGRFEEEIRSRGFHLIEAGQQLVVICHSGPIRLRF